MSRYFSKFLLIERIKITKIFNGMVYGIRKVPLIGKHLGDRYYFYDLKEIVNTFVPIFSIIWQFIKSILTFGFAIIISRTMLKFLFEISDKSPLFFRGNFDLSLGALLLTCIPFVFYISNMITSSMLTDNGNVFSDLSKNFNFFPDDLARIFLYLQPFLIFIGRTLGFVIFGKIFANINPIYTFAFSLGLYFYNINMTCFWTKIYEKKEKLFFEDRAFLQIILILILDLLISLMALIIKLDFKILSLGFFFINLILFPFAVKYFKNFKGYDKIIEKTINVYKIAVKDAKNIQDGVVKIENKDINKKEKIKGEGFVYLNNLFFKRHKKHLLKPTLIKSGIFLILGIGGFLFASSLIIKAKEVYKISIFIIPIISYILFKQDLILMAFYKNCDSSLLYYNFYREDKNLLKMFWLRFASIFKLMLIPMGAMFTIYIGFAIKFLIKTDLNLLLPIFYILLNAIFFTVLPLFQYYIIQPFDKEGKQKSVVLVLMNIFLYYIFIFGLPALTAKIGEIKFMLIISIFMVAFVGLASFLIYKFSPKTFKIKQ
ncbi:MAG: hypothetical protein E7I76_05275 [Anaerococcus vaginalis]|uniref:hypothetical protein n=1 Tax=Anaerococcus vaginalis TaxID=33037 RepID=UPI0029110995|nr:hypothetical protein [Anaerococcus vaginalis]MDU4447395.1 hypothetical protein [Anaerococcus vaginalis]MDU6182203.1 hypothetical protein [Anaerococcus vaginalis]MDU7433032.1 hypothetical protein [Anaerococcus vaginalis]